MLVQVLKRINSSTYTSIEISPRKFVKKKMQDADQWIKNANFYVK